MNSGVAPAAVIHGPAGDLLPDGAPHLLYWPGSHTKGACAPRNVKP